MSNKPIIDLGTITDKALTGDERFAWASLRRTDDTGLKSVYDLDHADLLATELLRERARVHDLEDQLRLRAASGGIDGRSTADYRKSVSEGGPMYAAWENKPHRLVYDLCDEIDRLAKKLKRLRSMHCCVNCSHANECSMEGREPVCWDDPDEELADV